MCGAALLTRYSQEFDIPVFDKSDAFSRLLQWLVAGTTVRSRYEFELSNFDIVRFDCIRQATVKQQNTSLSPSAKSTCNVAIARMIATSACIVLLRTSGMYVLLSSLVKPPS